MNGVPGPLPMPQTNEDYYYPTLGTVVHNRYLLLRKLGQGTHASLWLASTIGHSENCPQDTKYCAIKILTASATQHELAGITQERDFMRLIANREVNGLPILLDDFELVAPNGRRHICLVMYALGPNLSDFRNASPDKALQPHIVKSIIAQLLDTLNQLHSAGIIHTDIKPGNILLHCPSDQDIEHYLATFTPIRRRIRSDTEEQNANGNELHSDPEDEDDILYQSRSCPIPEPHKWNCSPHEAETLNVTLVDFGKAQAAGQQPTVAQFAAGSLRTPEDILHAYFGPKIDIWAIGCLTFELLTGRWLFHPEAGDTWTEEDDHLARMLELTGDEFTPQMLGFSANRDEYFDEDGKLRRVPELLPRKMEDALRAYKVPEAEIPLAAQFIRDCLRLDPLLRPSAQELELHRWLATAFEC